MPAPAPRSTRWPPRRTSASCTAPSSPAATWPPRPRRSAGTTGATYRPHPSERDRASRRQHARWERAGIRVDRAGGPLAELTTPVVSVFSTGVLEAAARGIPAWVDFPGPPIVARGVLDALRDVAPGASAPTPSPVLPGRVTRQTGGRPDRSPHMSIAHALPDPGPRRLQGHPAQEPARDRRQAADRVDDRARASPRRGARRGGLHRRPGDRRRGPRGRRRGAVPAAGRARAGHHRHRARRAARGRRDDGTRPRARRRAAAPGDLAGAAAGHARPRAGRARRPRRPWSASSRTRRSCGGWARRPTRPPRRSTTSSTGCGART